VRPVVVAEVFQQVQQAMGALAAAAGVRIVAHAMPDAIALSDGPLLVQVLVNFVDNAVRHGTGGEVVTLGAELQDTHVRITVDDEGPGIPAHERARVWERFVRLEARTPSPGSGIGLAVAASVIERLGASTWIEDAPGAGARFVVQLPSGAPATASAETAHQVA
jgi:signal transduction histidine kinase